MTTIPDEQTADYERETWWERIDLVTLLIAAATLGPAAPLLLGGAR